MKVDFKVIIKYLESREADTERAKIIQWFNDFQSEKDLREKSRIYWDNITQEITPQDYEETRLLGNIYRNIKIREEKSRSGIKKKKIVITFLSKVAAVLFIPLLILSIYMAANSKLTKESVNKKDVTYTRVFSPVGSVSEVDLPDGTRVWLNHNTSLVYPNSFSNSSRKVRLKGEAFFEVKHNPLVPFIVKTGDLKIVATGTEFNVMAFPDNNRIETTLISGIVKIQKRNKDGNFKPVFEMQPNELAVYYTKSNKLEYCRTNIDKHILWKDGKLLFENDPLDRVSEKLSRFYNVEIILKDSILSEFTYTATFEDETLVQVLELLRLATPIDFSIKSRKKLNDNTWTKKEVYLSYKIK